MKRCMRKLVTNKVYHRINFIAYSVQKRNHITRLVTHLLFVILDPSVVGGLMPIMVTGISQTGDFLGYITGINIENGICSAQKNSDLLSKYSVEQISSG